MTWQRCAARRTKHRIVWLYPDAVLANHSWRTDESGCSWRKRKRRATAALQGQYRACAPQRAAHVSSVIARARTKLAVASPMLFACSKHLEPQGTLAETVVIQVVTF